MKTNPSQSRQKGEKDSKHDRISDLVVAAPYSPEEVALQDTRFETKKNPEAGETRSTLHRTRKRRNKSNLHKNECDQYSSNHESSEHKEETEPGAYNIARTHATENHPIQDQEPQTMINGSYMVDGDVNERAMLVEADLAPELTLAEEVNIQEEEAVIAKKIHYKRALNFAMFFLGLAIIFNIVGFVFVFLIQPHPNYRYEPILYGFIESACFFVVATLIMLHDTTTGCCASAVTLEQYAPDDKELLRESYIASVVAFCLFIFVAIPIIGLLPKLLWVGYTCMAWYFAATVFTFSRVQLLRRSIETREKKPKCFWIIFLAFFLGLSGATIWHTKPLYPDCDVPIWIGNVCPDALTVCYSENSCVLFSKDYPGCSFDYHGLIGNGICDGEAYNTTECGYDGGDCIKDYPDCMVQFPSFLGDGDCDGGSYNRIECGYDGGDCVVKDYPNCIVPYPSWIGDGKCDGRLYGTVECGLDGGDCLGPGERCRGHRECALEVCNPVTKVCDPDFVFELYPNCSVSMPDWIGDGECDGGYYASEACGFDGGDCLKLDEPCLQDDECASGFCNAETKVCYLGILENYTDCVVEYPVKIGDGKCDGGVYAWAECGYDGGDCIDPS